MLFIVHFYYRDGLIIEPILYVK